MRLQLAAVLASVAGVAVSVYLTSVHYAGVPLACPATARISCEAVLSSAYGVIAGTSIPTSAAGLVWFAVSALLWTRPPSRLHMVWSALGLLTVLYLVFIEVVVLGAICVWCSLAHLLVLAIAVIAAARPPARGAVPR
ncbi:MAG TPA: vitamin K epoxide reductase family protein [Candidatus Dormibacteraeota bacterium]|nr:vitamin K epoxide reductase family protein [Candidatus Dormibacteraeota bacterium]